MTKYLSKILQINEAVFSNRISKLEQATLQTGVDIRLTNDIRIGVNQKLHELGLDPNDTTAEELYNALKLRVLEDENKLKKVLGIKESAGSVEISVSYTHLTLPTIYSV